MSKLLEKTRKFVDEAYGGVHPHLERTLYWVMKLKPDADEALQIAAYSHDIERVSKSTKSSNMPEQKGLVNEEFLRNHQERGSKIMAEFLRQNSAPEEVVNKVSDLISSHEFWGTEEQNILKDADSISFFETNKEHFLNKKLPELGIDIIKEKFEWMFNRITSEEAKEIARPMYEDSSKELNAIKN